MAGIINGSVLISYDIKFNHNEVKEELKKKGYLDYWVDQTGETHELPNTTLIKDNTNVTAAKLEVQQICRHLRARLNKLVCVRFRIMSGI